MYNPSAPATWREGTKSLIKKLIRFISENFGTKILEQLDKLGVSRNDFAKQILTAPAIGFILGAMISKIIFHTSITKSIVVGLVFAGIGLALARVALAKGMQEYRMNLVYAIPDWVNNLKISLIAGDMVEDAVWSSIDFVDGPLKKIIVDLKRQTEGNVEFGNALDTLINQTEEPELLMVLHRLQSYHSAGIANRREVFLDMAEHLGRVRMDRATAILERIKAPLFFLMLAGLVSLLLRIGVPFIIMSFKKVMG